MSIDICQSYCQKCIYVGKYNAQKCLENGFNISMMNRFRENRIRIKRQKVFYNITICLTGNKKKIIVEADSQSLVQDMYYIIMEILRFENLFEGLFYSVTEFWADEIDCLKEIKDIQLAYYESTKQYTYFEIDFSDKVYKSYYSKWLKREKKNRLIHPVFLFSTYLEGMPVDLRLAILLEIFEPLAEELHNRGEIVLVKEPFITYHNKCKNCGAYVSRKDKNKKLSFNDKIKPLIKKYGKIIFEDDNRKKLVEKSIKIRNKIDHVNVDTKNVLSGEQCGVYLYKYSLLYRYIVLLDIGIDSSQIEPAMKLWLDYFNHKYKLFMICK